jgi:hypothetical protein
MTRHFALAIAFAGIAAIIAAVVLGPFFSDPNYSSLSNTLSELAGQNMPAAWIMRLGFVAFGLSVIVAVVLRFRALSIAVGLPLVGFGAAMIAAAIWSNLPIDADLGGSREEDTLHSVAASAMGFCFAGATLAQLWRLGFPSSDWLSWLGLGASVVLPLGMATWPDVDGALQRMMFAISFVWIAHTISAQQLPEHT